MVCNFSYILFLSSFLSSSVFVLIFADLPSRLVFSSKKCCNSEEGSQTESKLFRREDKSARVGQRQKK